MAIGCARGCVLKESMQKMRNILLIICLVGLVNSCIPKEEVISLSEKNNFLSSGFTDTLYIDESKSISLDISEYPNSSHLLLEFVDRLYWMSIDPSKNSTIILSRHHLVAVNSPDFDGFSTGEVVRVFIGNQNGKSAIEKRADYMTIFFVE